MFCTKCGKEIPENGVCDCENEQPQQQQQQQPQQPQQQPAQQQPPQFQPQQPAQQNPYYANQQPTDKIKLYSILSYIPLLWLIGMSAQNEKNDPRVRFHVGQGIILSIYYLGCTILTSILSAIFFAVLRSEQVLFGYATGIYKTSPIAWLLSTVFWLFTEGSYIALAIIGIMGITQNKDKPLPIIGNFAFYK